MDYQYDILNGNELKRTQMTRNGCFDPILDPPGFSFRITQPVEITGAKVYPSRH
jgi:hypothetical protein